MKDTTTMKITKQQLADLVRGIGSVHVSTGGYEGDIAYTALGMVYQALADERFPRSARRPRTRR